MQKTNPPCSTSYFSFFVRLVFSVCALLGVVEAAVRDGRVDQSLAISPINITNGGNARIDCITQLPGGKILVGGAFSTVSAGGSKGIARLNSDGSFDPTFYGDANNRVLAIFPLNDGKILISGDFLQYSGVARNRIARINSDGSLDLAFNPNFGSDYIQIVAIQSDGKIIVNGTFLSIGGIPRNRVARLNADGSVDLSFTVGAGTNNAGVTRAFVQPDGKIIFAGRFSSYDSVPRDGVLRLNADGSLDLGFVPPTSGVAAEIFDICPAANGKLYIAGYIGASDTVRRLNADGSIDATFNTSNTHTATSGRVYSVREQSDAKVIVGGEFDAFSIDGSLNIRYRLFRFNADGSKDASFVGQAGSSYSSGGVRALAIYDNDKILVGGDFPQLNGSFRGGLGRLNLDSTLDNTFVGSLGYLTTINAFHNFPNGKILVAGGFDAIGTSFHRNVAMLNSNGSVDNSFVIDSRVDHVVYSVAIQTDGKILLGGYTGDSGFGSTLGKGVWRINADGSLDTTFDTQIAALESVWSIALQADGKILIGGGFSAVNGISRRAIARLHANGSLDTTFTPNIGGLSTSKIVVQPDGKIIVGGGFTTVNGSPIANVVRLNQDGSVDTSFSIGGGANNSVTAILVLPDSKIYLGGTFSSFNGISRRSLVRLQSNGTVDEAFAPNLSSGVNAIVRLPNNKIVVGGAVTANADAAPRQKILRLLDDGSVDFSFDVSGATYNSSSGTVWHLGIQPDGDILAAGQFDGISGVARSGFARLLMNTNVTPAIFDFDGDGRTDISVFRPSSGIWYRINSYFNQFRATAWGTNGDVIVPSDFDGDFRTDIAVFRPDSGVWYVFKSSNNSFLVSAFGTQGDIAVPGDYDGDGKADIAIFRPSDRNWWINRSTGGLVATQFGATGDKPVAADYDGDGKSDIAIYRPSGINGAEWWVQRSSNGGVFATQFGQPTDKAVPGDYTGDGKADIAFWTPSSGNWFVLRSEDFSYYAFPFGATGDVPSPGDYDGDGKLDAAVFRPSSATWYANRSTAGTLIQQFGITGDLPVPSAFMR